jgi:hypothetical protein
MTKLNLLAAPLILASILFVACIAPAQTPTQTNAQQQAASSTVPVTTVVTVLGPSYTAPPALGKEDVVVHTGSRREDVTAWTPAQGQRAPLQLAILIDDGAGINSQLPDLRHFIQTQSNSTSVGLFYASMGTTQTVAPFSTDHDAVAKKLRITEGRTGVSTSIYLSTIDVMKKLAPMSGRREILLIGDGRDRLRGDLDSPDVQRVIDTAQKTGIVIHTLYASVGRGGFNSIRLGYAQSNLTRVAGETGGQSFFQGLETPVSFTPFLDQLDMVLHNQYFLTFTTARSHKKKGEFRGFKVATEQRNIAITAASQIFVPGP